MYSADFDRDAKEMRTDEATVIMHNAVQRLRGNEVTIDFI